MCEIVIIDSIHRFRDTNLAQNKQFQAIYWAEVEISLSMVKNI